MLQHFYAIFKTLMKELEIITQNLKDNLATIEKVEKEMKNSIAQAGQEIITCLKNKGKILICGNGGSAADSQHMAAELAGRYLMNREPLPAIALSTDTSILTAIGNDFGFDQVFVKQVKALGNKGDILIGISTSGNSANVIEAMKIAKNKGMKNITLLGRDGGKMKALADINLIVPSSHTPRIQEAHGLIIHIICELVEKGLFS